MAITEADGDGEPAAAPAELPSRIGRYVIQGLLGTGGMAVVYLARDPMLARAVALKVIRADGDERAIGRLLREAQAIAKISHPNVIQVHDVGRERDELVYIAMERIEGPTLAAWLGSPRSVREILDVFVAAGRGLAAAHAAGLVHRDFKPENVIVGSDGRVRVLDFGLARSAEGADLTASDHARAETLRAWNSGAILGSTAMGAVLGTPVYMSPEQWLGQRPGVACDQFSYCVALYRALAKEHPFELLTREGLRDAVVAGRFEKQSPAIPRPLRAVLRRGMSASPEARYPRIDEVVDAVQAAARPFWRFW